MNPAAPGWRRITLTTRLFSRTFIVNASAATKVNGPASARGRVRNAVTCSSRSWAIRETCDFDKLVIPNVATSLSIRRVETPSRKQVATTEINADSARLRRSSSQSGKYDPSRSFGIATSIVPARVSRSRCR